jgi:hypothetical protein
LERQLDALSAQGIPGERPGRRRRPSGIQRWLATNENKIALDIPGVIHDHEESAHDLLGESCPAFRSHG